MDAREIHTCFKIGTDFSTWIQKMLKDLDAKEGIDYKKTLIKEQRSLGPCTRKVYDLSESLYNSIILV